MNLWSARYYSICKYLRVIHKLRHTSAEFATRWFSFLVENGRKNISFSRKKCCATSLKEERKLLFSLMLAKKRRNKQPISIRNVVFTAINSPLSSSYCEGSFPTKTSCQNFFSFYFSYPPTFLPYETFFVHLNTQSGMVSLDI